MCRAWRSLIDGSSLLAGGLALSWSTHLGAHLRPFYPTLEDFLASVERVAATRAPVLRSLRLDMEAYGLPLAMQLLALPLPRLQALVLQNAEPNHLMDLAALPMLRALSLSRHMSGIYCPGGRAAMHC